MITHSKIKTYPIIFFATIATAGIFAFLLLLAGRFDNEMQLGKLVAAGIFLFVVLLFGRQLLNLKQILIDSENQVVIVKNPLSNRNKTYPLRYFDGYSERSNFNSLFGAHKVLHLLKEHKVVYSISSGFYENYTELKDALSCLEDLGTLDTSILTDIKIFFGLPIMKS